MTYDVIVIGGGSAGCVLAARLSEDPDRSVLLLEAGPDYGDDPAAWPAEMLDAIHYDTESHNWGYVNKQSADGNRVSLPRARVLGGSSTVNGTIWARGSRSDYNGWAELGNPGWGFDDVIPYFKRAESDPELDSPLSGKDGPMRVQRVDERVMTPFSRALVESAAENGYAWTPDINDPDEGPSIGMVPCNIAHGIRWNTAIAYLNPARERSNLTIVPDAITDRLIFENGAVTGVTLAGGREFRGREVIVAGGTYGSPAILMRSGIGPADHLEALSIPVVHDLPGVGSHLMDHPSVLVAFRIAGDHQPPSATRVARVETLIKARSRQMQEDYDLHIVSHGTAIDDEYGVWALVFRAYLEYSRSLGTVRLASTDPEVPLAIDHNYLDDPADLEGLADGVEILRDLTRTPPLSTLLDGELRPGTPSGDREALRHFVRRNVTTTFHPACSCRMGPASDPMSVVDQQGMVHGIRGLRVCDASIFPRIPRANLNWPVIATAERIAAMVRGESRQPVS